MNYDERYIKNLLPKRPEDSHKGTFGHVLNIAGSGFYSGAAYFSSLAPLKVGAGRSTLASVEFVLSAVAALSPDIILFPRETLFNKGLKPLVEIYQAISIGCGLSTDRNTAKFFEKFLKSVENSQTPLVIDADGLTLLALRHCEAKDIDIKKGFPPKQSPPHPHGLLKLPQNTILTPHPAELSRLMGVSVENILENQEFWAQKCSEKYKCITILKTHKTLIVDEKGHLYRNNTGNSALAKGGSGDVLCGMITGFLAQGVKPFDACILAVYLHGKAGEIMSRDLGEYSPLSSDLLNYIHLAIRNLA